MKRTTKRIITISSVLVVILALLCTGVSLYINSIFDRIEKIPEVSRVDPSNEFFETDSPEESPTTAPVVKPEDIGWGEIEPFLDDKLWICLKQCVISLGASTYPICVAAELCWLMRRRL